MQQFQQAGAVKISAFLITFFFVFTLLAQDNYWRQQFGAVSTLTGGAGVSSVRDNGAIYYNPGALGLIDSSSISLTTDVYGFDYYNLKNEAGKGLGMKSFKADVFPQIAAGSLILKKIPKLRISYATLTRFNNSYKFDVNYNGSYNIIPNQPGNQFYKARAEYELSSFEQWAGGGIGYKVNKTLSLGLSGFLSYLDFESHTSTSVTADANLDSMPYSASVNEYNGSDIQQFNMILKAGAAIDLGDWKIGLALTIPSIKLWSSGSIDKSLQGYNLNYNATDTNGLLFKHNSFVIQDAADNLKTYYFEPFSMSGGVSYQMDRWTLHGEAEFFAGKKNIVIMNAPQTEHIQPYASYAGDSVNNFLQIKTIIVPILNVGLGAEYQWRKNISLLCGIRTDFSNQEQFLPNNDNLGIQSFNVPSWHYVHFSLGSSYKKGGQLITAGFNYGVGIPTTRYQAINLTQPEQNLFLRGATTTRSGTSVQYLTFMLGYTYYFKK